MWGMPPKYYIYPDGTKTINKPNDGEVFVEYDHKQVAKKIWQYDGLKDHWYDVSPGSATPAKGISISTQKIELEKPKAKGPPPIPKCDCGSEKCGSNRHSSWCSKYPFQS